MKLVLALCIASLPILADEIVFHGLPTIRALATVEHDARQDLDADASQKAECIVVQQGKKYYWRSRDNGEMLRVDTPQYTYFIHKGGLGFVKVFTGERDPKATAEYLESITNGLQVI